MSDEPTKRPRRGGRKKQDLEPITVRLSPAWLKALDELSDQEGKSIAELIRDALRERYGLKAQAA